MPRGGARPGSGPKPKPDAMVTRAFVITQEQARWLEVIARETGANKSAIVREIIEESNYARLKRNLTT